VPELPELEVFKRYVDSTSLHQDIEIVEVKNGKILGGVSASGLKRGLEGRKFESTRRHGKHLFVELDKGPWLLLHFGKRESFTNTLVIRAGSEKEVHIAYLEPILRPPESSLRACNNF
jgi:formamidopyrimidine-DNA glycosylase